MLFENKILFLYFSLKAETYCAKLVTLRSSFTNLSLQKFLLTKVDSRKDAYALHSWFTMQSMHRTATSSILLSDRTLNVMTEY